MNPSLVPLRGDPSFVPLRGDSSCAPLRGDEATAQVLEPRELDFDLIDDDGEPLATPWHRKQINLFAHVAHAAMAERGKDDYYVGGDMFVYYSREQAREVAKEAERHRQLPLPLGDLPRAFDSSVDETPPLSLLEEISGLEVSWENFKGPDVFMVMGDVDRHRDRRVWASWLEGDRLPDFILELQSKSTAAYDEGEKKDIYADVFKSPEYFHYGPDQEELGRRRDVLVGHRLDRHGRYRQIAPDKRGFLWSEVLGLWLGRWDGTFEDNEEDRWIRLYDAQGRLVPTGEEAERGQKEIAEKRAEAERRQKEIAEKRAEAERQQKETERRQKEIAEKRAAAAEAEIARLRNLLDADGP